MCQALYYKLYIYYLQSSLGAHGGLVPGPTDSKNCGYSSPSYNVLGFAHNLYSHIGYSSVCLHITSFTWIQCSAQHGKFKFCIGEISGIFSPKISSIFYWLNLWVQNPQIWRTTIINSHTVTLFRIDITIPIL